MGTPQAPLDWSDPEAWIAERLSGTSADLARRVWTESGMHVNPRHVYGAYLFINTFKLLEPDAAGVYRLTSRGTAFLRQDDQVVREIDDAEGLGELLSLLATKGRCMRADLLPEWGAFLRDHSNFGTASTTKDTLRRRLVNLVERGFVARDGNTYLITPNGLEYAARFSRVAGGLDPRAEVIRAVNAYNASQVENLREYLSNMPPTEFEHLIRDLLESMGYEDVSVTRQSGDKGVDVVAMVQFGITTITEVVQVKRQRGSIGRPVLDQLRGALPYFKALRGTIITLGTFSKGCKEVAIYPGAAPITLIDGGKLMELLVKHEVGLQKRQVLLIEFDAEAFRPVPDDTESIADPSEDSPSPVALQG
ncbi:restriction system protein [bacterium JGI 053]|nr:restriction system protein [bacterium JGI 053]